MDIEEQQQHWTTIARHWSHVGSPLRPCPEDIENFGRLLGLSRREPVRALILGVTPELYHLAWPSGSTVHSVDKSEAMTNAIWPGPAGSSSNADWRDLPFPSGSFDYVLCDGGLHLLDYLHSQQSLSTSLGRILKKDGLFIIRLFVMPEQRERPESVIADLRAGSIRNIHIFKLRLGMALQSSAEEGIVLNHVYQTIRREFGSLDELGKTTGWPLDEVRTLTSYRLSQGRYHFITRQRSIEILTAGEKNLVLERCLESHYPLGDRCPILSFRKANSP